MTTPSPEATRAAERICETWSVGFPEVGTLECEFDYANTAEVATLIDAEFAALRERVGRLSRIEAAAVAYRDTYRRYDLAAENGTPLEWAEAGSDESEAMAALFATLPSSEETTHAR